MSRSNTVIAGHGSVSHNRDDPRAQRVPSWLPCTILSYYLMAASTEWASQGMVVSLTVGMTLVLKLCPSWLSSTILSNYLMAASTEWASQCMVVCLSHSRDDPRAQRVPSHHLMATLYHIIWLPYGSLHRVSLAGHGSVSHSRDDPRAQRMPRRGRGMSTPCTQNIRDATGTGKYTLGTAAGLL